MRAQKIYETLEFKEDMDPYLAIGIGNNAIKQQEAIDVSSLDLRYIYNVLNNQDAYNERIERLTNLFKNNLEIGDVISFNETKRFNEYMENNAGDRFIYNVSYGSENCWVILFSDIKFPEAYEIMVNPY